MKESETKRFAKYLLNCLFQAFKGNKFNIVACCLLPIFVLYKTALLLAILFDLQILLVAGLAWSQGDLAGKLAGLDMALEGFKKHHDEKIISMLNDLPSPETEKLN